MKIWAQKYRSSRSQNGWGRR